MIRLFLVFSFLSSFVSFQVIHDRDLTAYFFTWRYYDPCSGQFTQPDPFVANLTDAQDLNHYAYVRNSPLKYNDPSGNIPQNVQVSSLEPQSSQEVTTLIDLSQLMNPGSSDTQFNANMGFFESLLDFDASGEPIDPSGRPVVLDKSGNALRHVAQAGNAATYGTIGALRNASTFTNAMTGEAISTLFLGQPREATALGRSGIQSLLFADWPGSGNVGRGARVLAGGAGAREMGAALGRSGIPYIFSEGLDSGVRAEIARGLSRGGLVPAFLETGGGGLLIWASLNSENEFVQYAGTTTGALQVGRGALATGGSYVMRNGSARAVATGVAANAVAKHAVLKPIPYVGALITAYDIADSAGVFDSMTPEQNEIFMEDLHNRLPKGRFGGKFVLSASKAGSKKED